MTSYHEGKAELILIVFYALIPLMGVLFFGFSHSEVVWVYWFEIIIASVISLVKVLVSNNLDNDSIGVLIKHMRGKGFFIVWNFALIVFYYELLKLLLNNAGISFELKSAISYISKVFPLVLVVLAGELLMFFRQEDLQEKVVKKFIFSLIGQVCELLIFASLFFIGYILVFLYESPLSLILFITAVRIIAGIVKVKVENVEWPIFDRKKI